MEKAKTEALISQIGNRADFKIENNGSFEEFHQQIEKIIKSLK